jgi:hypothetical protein
LARSSPSVRTPSWQPWERSFHGNTVSLNGS